MSQPLGVIFDMDGVLVDSYRAHFDSWQRAARGHGLDMTETDFARTFGRTSGEIIEQLWPSKFDAPGKIALDDQKERAYREILKEHFPAMPGATELIQSLHAAGIRMAIGSSGPPENVAVVHQQLPGGNLIEVTVNRTHVTRGKPDPQVFLVAAQKLGIPPARCAVIEDAPVGLKAARAAGMKAIGLTGTVDRATLEPLADVVVQSLNELTPNSIAGLIGR